MLAPPAPRVERLAAALAENGADAFLAWNPLAVGYLANLWEHPHRRFALFAVSAGGESCAIVPALGHTSAEEAGIRDVRPWRDGEDPVALFAALAEEWDLRSAILAVDEDTPARMLLAMQDALPAALFRPGGSLLASLMRRKEPFEIALMEEAARRTDEVYAELLPTIRAGETEAEIAARIEGLMRSRGVEPAFAIVAGGPNSAKPHHQAGERPLRRGEVLLLDFGGTFERYGSDITRVVHLGEAPEAVRSDYRAVWRAHEAARAGIRPGTAGAEADALARDALAADGLADLFVHRLGHGIGLNGHEDPYLVGTNPAPLEIGDAFTIEPGVYRPSEWGVRLENTFVLEEGGPRSLNAPIAPEMLEI